MEIIWRVISWEGEGENAGNGAGIKYKLVGTKYMEDVKNSIGNEEAKELVCMAHGHELKWGNCCRKWG